MAKNTTLFIPREALFYALHPYTRSRVPQLRSGKEDENYIENFTAASKGVSEIIK